MSASLDWVELFGQQRKRKEYTQALLELKTGKLEAIATWLAVLELVSFLQTLESSKEDEQIKGERTSWIDYSSQIVSTHSLFPPCPVLERERRERNCCLLPT